MDTTIIDYRRKIKNYTIFIGILLLCIIALIAISDATVTPFSFVNVTNTTENSIKWSYNTTYPIVNASFNGLMLEDFDTKSNEYIWYTPYSAFGTFCIYTSTGEKVCESGNTTPASIKSDEKIYDFIFKWLYLFITLILVIAGIRIPFLGIMGFLFSLLGFTSTVASSGEFMFDIIYMFGMIASVYIVYEGVKK